MADYWYNFGQKSEQKNLQISSIFTSNQGLFSWVCHIVPYPVISFSHREVQWFYCKNGFITETIIFGNVCIQLWHQYQPIVWSSHTVKYWDLGFKDEDWIEVSSEITPMLIFLFCKRALVVWNDKVDTNERSNMANPGFEPRANFPDQYWLTFRGGKNCSFATTFSFCSHQIIRLSLSCLSNLSAIKE